MGKLGCEGDGGLSVNTTGALPKKHKSKKEGRGTMCLCEYVMLLMEQRAGWGRQKGSFRRIEAWG